MTPISASALHQEIQARAARQDRFLVAIAGAPGSGKSTLAADLATRLGPTADVLPMDGFHLDNAQLHQMGLFDRKGAPETFDAQAFAQLLRQVRNEPDVSYPTFDRDADRTVANAGHIDKTTRIVLVEGNYLLLNTPPWSDLAELFDMTVQIDVPRSVLEARLIARWLDHELPPAKARARALGNDMANADLVIEHSRAPDFFL